MASLKINHTYIYDTSFTDKEERKNNSHELFIVSSFAQTLFTITSILYNVFSMFVKKSTPYKRNGKSKIDFSI